MQTTSSGWNSKVTAPFRTLAYNVGISFSQQTASGVNFFTIGTSLIGGSDILKSGGSSVAFFDKYTFKDYTPYVMSINVKRGIGQYPYGSFMAQADVELDNSSRIFLPGYDSTIGSGILPNRPLKIALGLTGEMLNQFTGFAGMPENSVGDRVTTLHAYDAFNYIAGFVSQASGALVGLYANQIMASLLGEMGFGVGQYVLDSSLQQPIGYIATYNLKAGDVFQSLCEAEQGLAFADENGIIRFWNRQHLTTTSGTKAFQLNYSQIGDLQYENTPIINDVIVKANPRAVQANQKIWELSGSITLAPGVQTLYIATFSDNDGNLPVTGIDIPVNLPNSTTSYFAANDQSDGSGNDKGSSVVINSAYSYGYQYWITFSNPTSSYIYITSMGLYGTPAKVTVHIEQRYNDAASILSYGRNPSNNGDPLVISNDLIQDNSTANSLARTLVYEYKDARKRYKVPVAVNSDPSIQIGDFGTLFINDTNETKNVWVVGKEESLPRSGQYMQTLEVEERSIQSYFTIGTSTIGGSDTIAP